MNILKGHGIDCKLIRDPVYGYIEKPDIFDGIIDSRAVQRLRWVSQLPLEQLVYPSAQHSRFEHSIGVMYLSMLSAISLISNSRDKLDEAYSKDNDFKNDRDKDKNFILSCGLSGLLHDIGHAPFSHTFEEAFKIAVLEKSNQISFNYEHEHIGFKVIKKLFEEKNYCDRIFSKKALRILNKKLELTTISPIEIIIRKLIDGPIDVDKGDYLWRDSYHCGTNYGFYDIDRLWNNIVITNNFHIGVNTKSALEAWSLRIARYKMYKNVYKHHVRNITDTMLIDILAPAIIDNKDKPNPSIVPLDKKQEIRYDYFYSWTDNSLLNEIAIHRGSNDAIENFLSRNLLKRGCVINLSEYFYTQEIKSKIYLKIKDIKNSYKSKKDCDFSFLVEKEIVPPVFEKEVQNELIIKNNKDNTEKTLAEFLKLDRISIINMLNNNSKQMHNKIEDDDEGNLISSDHLLHIFIRKADKSIHINDIENDIHNALKELSVVESW